MSFQEELQKLRRRVVDATGSKVFDESNKDIIEALLIQIVNDAERNRQQCMVQAESLRKEASKMDGQAGAFASMSSIVYNVLNGFVRAAERTKEDSVVPNVPETVKIEKTEKSAAKQEKGKKKK